MRNNNTKPVHEHQPLRGAALLRLGARPVIVLHGRIKSASVLKVRRISELRKK